MKIFPDFIFSVDLLVQKKQLVRFCSDSQNHVYKGVFISGPCSSGKTHLLNSIEERINKSLIITRWDAAFFGELLIDCIKENKPPIELFRFKDIFLIDNFECFKEKPNTLKLIDSLFNCCFALNKKIVLSSASKIPLTSFYSSKTIEVDLFRNKNAFAKIVERKALDKGILNFRPGGRRDIREVEGELNKMVFQQQISV